ncbi:MAG TPA: polyketide cyclase [Lachnospiraceae bacterium]|nr:polyketide cyclase [Lachnospiraceae bacterium]
MSIIENEIWIDKDIDSVFDITNQIERWKDLFQEYQESTVLSTEGNRIRFRLTKHPDKEGNTKSWISERFIHKENYTCEAIRLYPKFPFVIMYIYWEYKPLNNGTLMKWVQKFKTDVKCQLTEKQMSDYLDKNTKIEMQVIKEKIEKGFC